MESLILREPKRPRIVIAGATGFIGTAVCRALAPDYDLVALTRSPTRASITEEEAAVTWRHCDLFGLGELETALAGADYAIYLVHSMAPSSRLTQAHPEDLDLVLADNFGRAAGHARLKQILFVGGIMPQGFDISRLLWSRRETEMALGAYGVPVTSLRADLVVGPGSSSLKMLVTLVRRLPVIPLPRAAHSRSRPIAITDLVRAIRLCLGNPASYSAHFDIGGPEALSYRELVSETAQVLGIRRPTFTLPFLPLRLAAWIMGPITGSPAELVRPLVESLRQDAPVRRNRIQEGISAQSVPFRQALAETLDSATGMLLPSPRLSLRQQDDRAIREVSVVRSIQRIFLPPGQDAGWVAGNYFRWLPRLCWPFLRCDFDALGSCGIYVRFPRLHLLTLTFKPEHSSPGLQVYFITAGLLARSQTRLQGRFEFREVLGARYVIAGIHDYAPALPWYIYMFTQAPVHLVVMRIYQRHLARLAR